VGVKTILCVIGVASDGESMYKPIKVVSGHLLGRQEWANSMKVASGDVGS
jgi:hypothetical protein